MSYKTSISNNSVTITLSSNKHKTNVQNVDHKISLSRTGGQGAKGDSVSRVYINSESDLIVEISNGVGDLIETINAGNIFADADLGELNDVLITDVQDGDIIRYEAETQTYVNHRLTTTSVSDIDNTNRADGSVLVYNGTTQKYTATNTIENENTTVLGGTF
jgi:hypothetical protein